MAGGCGAGSADKAPAADSTASAASPEAAGGAKELTTPQAIFEAMVAAYKSAQSYSDNGIVHLVAEAGDQKIDDHADFSVTMVRPNKLRMVVYQARLTCDGQKMYAAMSDLPDQVIVKDAPAQLDVKSVYFDRLIATAMGQGIAGASPQLMMLLEKDPLAILLRDAEAPVLGEAGEIDGHKYYRVQMKRPDGTAVFWIDQQTYALRRIVLPTDELRQTLGQQGTVKSLSLVADFPGAQLNRSVDAKSFQFDMPQGAEVVKFLVPPHPAQLLGKKVPAFHFFDLDKKPVDAAALAGKVAVLDFWATWCGPCRQSLPNFEKVYQAYKDGGKVVFYAVSVDQPQTENKALLDTFKELGVNVPIIRDLEQNVGSVFKTTGIPSTFILDANGVVQDFEVGGNPELAAALPQKIEKLIAGESIFEKPLEEYRKQLATYEKMLEKEAQGEDGGQPMSEDREIPKAEIAQRSEPKTLRLAPLWQCADVKAAGNILVVQDAKGPARLLVVDGWKNVIELGLDGKVLGNYPLEIDEKEWVTALRTTVAADGKRYYVGFASAQQRFHLFDSNWKKLFSFPEDALENKHDGIADVEFGDLDGDGTPEIYVGYWGVVGVQAVSLEGKRIFTNRSLANVVRVAVGGPGSVPGASGDGAHACALLCVNNSGSLAVLDRQLQAQGEVTVPDRLLQWIVAGDLEGNGKPLWCGMAAPQLGENVAIGVDLQGKELWNYRLPDGVHQQPIERIIPGKLAAQLPGQWLLPGPDGSIHVIAADGKPIDRFNYGAVLHGLATVDVDGRPVLLVASPQGVEALHVE
jgi:thiol-disulfide isomerase/thioredoxin